MCLSLLLFTACARNFGADYDRPPTQHVSHCTGAVANLARGHVHNLLLVLVDNSIWGYRLRDTRVSPNPCITKDTVAMHQRRDTVLQQASHDAWHFAATCALAESMQEDVILCIIGHPIIAAYASTCFSLRGMPCPCW
jgi:hypothetical protein